MKKTLLLILAIIFAIPFSAFTQAPKPGSAEYASQKKAGVLSCVAENQKKVAFHQPLENTPVRWDLFEPLPGESYEEGVWDLETGTFEKITGPCFQTMGGSLLATGASGCDDCSEGPVALGFTVSICGVNYTDMYINSNGNVTFGTDYWVYTGVGMPNATTEPMVAPFWGDVDTELCGQVRYKLVGGTRALVRWQNVGYYFWNCDKHNDFQLILTNGLDPVLSAGNNIGFDYNDMQWTTGDASLGVGGFGGDPAVVGINANDGINAAVIGLFDSPGGAYDGPAGLNDGIDFLDNKCFQFAAATLSGCTILPVELVSLDVTATADARVHIHWVTQGEMNNKGFTIERSVDGKNFTDIGWVDGSSNTSEERSYAFLDESVTSGEKLYYRLQQVSLDGTHTVSDSRLVTVPENAGADISPFFPNPAEDATSLSIYSQQAGQVEINLLNSLGQNVVGVTRQVLAGTEEFEIELTGLPPGIYMARISDSRGNHVSRSIVKQ